MSDLKAATKVLESLRELVADPQIDFGPAYEGAKQRQKEAIEIMKVVVQQLKHRSKP